MGAFSDHRVEYRVRRAEWSRDHAALLAVRRAVFVREQQVPESLEVDGRDDTADHFLAEDPGGRPLGTARLLPTGQIGRMAVQRDVRGQGIGDALLRAVLEHCREQGITRPFLHAQQGAVAFYRRHGFAPRGAPFTEAGIEHIEMEHAVDG